MVVNNYYRIGVSNHYIIVDDLNKMSKFFINYILNIFKISNNDIYYLNYGNYTQIINNTLKKYIGINFDEQEETNEKFAIIVDLSKSLGDYSDEYLKILTQKFPKNIITISYVSNYDDSKKIQNHNKLMSSPNVMIMFMRYSNSTLIGRYAKENLKSDIDKNAFKFLVKILENYREDMDLILNKTNECKEKITIQYIKENINLDKIYTFEDLIKMIIDSYGFDKVNKQTLMLEEKKNLEIINCFKSLLNKYSIDIIKKIITSEFEKLICIKNMQNKGLISLDNLFYDLKLVSDEDFPKELVGLNHRLFRRKIKMLDNIDISELGYLLGLIYQLPDNEFGFEVWLSYLFARRNWQRDDKNMVQEFFKERRILKE